eukprot:TRINITY_DN12403_c0_g1_i1.p1 TRINITY_DN12403_c0_g1~~TRINITY_DN12403_c0_g1_i1.p1  ORF type:complete len:586 (+),score=135.65 TRINITY_DN12403_c0_g1_i1:153-1760(+)
MPNTTPAHSHSQLNAATLKPSGCPHTDRKHKARGMCSACYSHWRRVLELLKKTKQDDGDGKSQQLYTSAEISAFVSSIPQEAPQPTAPGPPLVMINYSQPGVPPKRETFTGDLRGPAGQTKRVRTDPPTPAAGAPSQTPHQPPATPYSTAHNPYLSYKISPSPSSAMGSASSSVTSSSSSSSSASSSSSILPALSPSSLSSHIYPTPTMPPLSVETCAAVLAHSKLHELHTRERTVFFVHMDAPIVHAFEGMVKHNIFSIPVAHRSSNNWRVFFDFADILACAINMFEAQDADPHVWDLAGYQEMFKALTVEKVLAEHQNKARTMHVLLSTYSVFYALETLAREPDLDRLVVIDSREQNTPVSIVTASQVVRWVYKHAFASSARAKLLGSMPHLLFPVESCRLSDRALDAFRLMERLHVRELPVLDTQDRLVMVLSVSDFHRIATDGHLIRRLTSTVEAFLAASDPGPEPHHGLDAPGPVASKHVPCCTVNDTLEAAAGLAVVGQAHRLLLVEDRASMKLIGPLSMKDILAEMLP